MPSFIGSICFAMTGVLFAIGTWAGAADGEGVVVVLVQVGRQEEGRRARRQIRHIR